VVESPGDKPLPVLGDPFGLLSKPSVPRDAKGRVEVDRLDPGALMAEGATSQKERLDRDPRALARAEEQERRKEPRASAPREVREISARALMRRVEEAPGRARVLYLHAAYCPACRKVTPRFVELARRYQERGVHFSAASVDRDQAAFGAYAPVLAGVLEPLLVERDSGIGASLRRLGVPLEGDRFGIPLVAVIDRRGKLVDQGATEVAELAATLDALLE
jgi:hypothetical protein